LDENGRDRYKCGFYDDTTVPQGQVRNWKSSFFNQSPHDSGDFVRSRFEYIGFYAMFLPDKKPKPQTNTEPLDLDFEIDLNNFMEKVVHPDVLVR